MRLVSMFSLSAVLLTAAVAIAAEATRFGVDVSEWSSSTAASVPVILPVGGSGQVNGNFVTGERNGVQIGIRASRRFSQNVAPIANSRDKSVNVYSVETGTSDGLGRAIWNYDIHVDLRGAKGVMKGKTLGDYDLVLTTNIGTTLFGLPVPLDVQALYALGGIDTATTLLLQTSQNPKFGNAPFNANAAGTYDFTLSLTPKTFNGPAIETKMSVVVTAP